jgi:hypothetical protein
MVLYTCTLTIGNRGSSYDRFIDLISQLTTRQDDHTFSTEDWESLARGLMSFSVEDRDFYTITVTKSRAFPFEDKTDLVADIVIYQNVFLVRRADLWDKDEPDHFYIPYVDEPSRHLRL